MTDLSGRCLCGKVTWASPGPVLWSALCHCESCRRATSSPFTSFFGVPRDSVTWSGPISRHQSSSGTVERWFCSSCGSPVSYRADRWADEAHLYTATLDDPQAVTPERHVHYDERVAWLRIADDLPKRPSSADDA